MANEEPLRVLVLCTGNSARSQMAEALFNVLGARSAVFRLLRRRIELMLALSMETLEHSAREARIRTFADDTRTDGA